MFALCTAFGHLSWCHAHLVNAPGVERCDNETIIVKIVMGTTCLLSSCNMYGWINTQPTDVWRIAGRSGTWTMGCSFRLIDYWAENSATVHCHGEKRTMHFPFWHWLNQRRQISEEGTFPNCKGRNLHSPLSMRLTSFAQVLHCWGLMILSHPTLKVSECLSFPGDQMHGRALLWQKVRLLPLVIEQRTQAGGLLCDTVAQKLLEIWMSPWKLMVSLETCYSRSLRHQSQARLVRQW